MNENSTMLYKYPGDDIRLRVMVDEELVWREFDTKIVPSDDVKKWLLKGWQKKPKDALNPPEPEPEPEPVPVVEEIVHEEANEQQPEEELEHEEELEPKIPKVPLADILSEIDKISGKDSKKRLISHALENDIKLTTYYNFARTKKEYIEKIKARYDLD